MTAVKVISSMLETTGASQSKKKAGRDVGADEVWISLSKYQDDFVNMLERWERHTRDPTRLGKRRAGAQHMKTGEAEDEELERIFSEGKWDNSKMIRTFSHLSTTDVDVSTSNGDGSRFVTYTLHPIPHSQWVNVRQKIKKAAAQSRPSVDPPSSQLSSPNASEENITESDGLVVDANRELRAKLFLGQVMMGWFWFIPAFHMGEERLTTHLILPKKEIDFPLGAGSWIIDVDIALDWATPDSEISPSLDTTDALRLPDISQAEADARLPGDL